VVGREKLSLVDPIAFAWRALHNAMLPSILAPQVMPVLSKDAARKRRERWRVMQMRTL
jgi:hypothetical protein